MYPSIRPSAREGEGRVSLWCVCVYAARVREESNKEDSEDSEDREGEGP